MALNINETTISLADFVSKLYTFLTTGGPGWSADRHVPGSGVMAVSKDDGAGQSVEVAFQWDTGTPSTIGVYQYHTGLGAGNYNTGAAPYAQTADSGNGANSTTEASLSASRGAQIGNTPVQYWCFAGSTYAHVVVETSTGVYLHFGFGVVEKFHDYTGGEYCYGNRFNAGPTGSVAAQGTSTHLLDGLCVGTSPAMQSHAGTIHLEGFPNLYSNVIWSVTMGSQTSPNLGTDRAGNQRGKVFGGFRAGPQAQSFGQFIGSVASALIPAYPLVLYYHDIHDTNRFQVIGAMKDVRGILMTNFESEDTVTIGADTWQIFPSYSRYSGSGAIQNTSGYQGIMYKVNP